MSLPLPVQYSLRAALLLVLGSAMPGPLAHAAELQIPHSFSAGTPALADEVNANFTAVKTEVDAKDARIAALESQLFSLQARIATIEGSNAMKISQYVRLVNIQDPNDGTEYPTVLILNANLQVRSTLAGRGNVIVGTNPTSTSNFNPEKCSIGQYDNGPDCVFNGGVWSQNHRSGSNNLIVGRYNSYSARGGFVAGRFNASNNDEASVAGGGRNVASGDMSVVSGGSSNVSFGQYAVVSGGWRNLAGGQYAVVSGGDTNVASGSLSWVGGGYLNVASGLTATVSGGLDNEASGGRASITGGYLNLASGERSAITGGRNNTAGGEYSSISGGRDDTLVTNYAWRVGDLVEFD